MEEENEAAPIEGEDLGHESKPLLPQARPRTQVGNGADTGSASAWSGAAEPSVVLPGSATAEPGAARWLLLLLAETIALLVLQVVLGVESGSLVLVADSPHSAGDAVTYGFNCWVEFAKLRFRQSNAMKQRYCEAHMLDAWSAGLSLVVLLVATLFAVHEAWQRLWKDSRLPPKQVVSANNWEMGSALMTFSVLSTAGNLAVLLAFRWWRLPQPLLPSSQSARTELPTLLGDAGIDSPEEEALAPPCAEPEPPAQASGWRRPRRPAVATGSLPHTAAMQKQLCRIGFGQHGKACTFGSGPACACGVSDTDAVPAARSPVDLGAGASTAPWSQRLSLHALAHPGCAAAGTCHSHSLNTSAALLHVMSDVARGIAIFAVALAMKLGLVQDEEFVDAACALVVAMLVIMGSGALLMEVRQTICHAYRGHAAMDDL